MALLNYTRSDTQLLALRHVCCISSDMGATPELHDCIIPISRATDVDFSRQSMRFHSASCVDCVTKQTVARHSPAHYSSHHWTSV